MLTAEYRYVPGPTITGSYSTWGVTDLDTGEFYPFGCIATTDRVVKNNTSENIANTFSSISLGIPKEQVALPAVPELAIDVVPVKVGRKFKNVFV